MRRWIIVSKTIPIGTAMYWKGGRGGWSTHPEDGFRYKTLNAALRTAAKAHWDSNFRTKPEVVEVKA